ncbi:MAG TPA: 23S rRNA (uracil(1939)-C(5))-methyltransferase RlmD [Dissulfurispiraceae bacterium]
MTAITLKAESPAYGGLSIGRWGGKVVMIKGALPGEMVEAVIEEEKKDFLVASAVKILSPSPDRIEPACALFGACGGCQFHYIAYPRQVALKEEVLRDSLKRIAKIELDLAPSLLHNDPWHYRYRGQFKADAGKVGFYREKTREVIDIESSPLMIPEVNEGLARARSIIKDRGGVHPLFDDIRDIHISYGERTVALLKSSRQRPGEEHEEQASLFMRNGFAGVSIESKDKKVLQHGTPFITLALAGLRYTVSALSFFQSHWRLNMTVVKFLKEELQPLRGMRVLDLYAGAGNFSLPLAVDAAEVIAVEENPYAIKDGKRNAQMNGISNCRFVRASAESFSVKNKAHVLILDPPRLGLANRTMEKVLALSPGRIAYISCNPSTLARDLRKLLAKYELESVRMIDFFPQTYHIESLALLRLR